MDDLDAVLAELRRRDVTIVGEPFVIEGDQRLAFIKDNSDNLIELATVCSRFPASPIG